MTRYSQKNSPYYQQHERGILSVYSSFILLLLIASAALYIIFPTAFGLAINKLPTDILISIWFAVLGAVAISMIGITQWRKESNKKFDKWFLWYVLRPPIGIIIGIVTYALLHLINRSVSVWLVSVASFMFGMHQHKFITFLNSATSSALKSLSTTKVPAKKTKKISGTQKASSKKRKKGKSKK